MLLNFFKLSLAVGIIICSVGQCQFFFKLVEYLQYKDRSLPKWGILWVPLFGLSSGLTPKRVYQNEKNLLEANTLKLIFHHRQWQKKKKFLNSLT